MEIKNILKIASVFVDQTGSRTAFVFAAQENVDDDTSIVYATNGAAMVMIRTSKKDFEKAFEDEHGQKPDETQRNIEGLLRFAPNTKIRKKHSLYTDMGFPDAKQVLKEYQQGVLNDLPVLTSYMYSLLLDARKLAEGKVTERNPLMPTSWPIEHDAKPSIYSFDQGSVIVIAMPSCIDKVAKKGECFVFSDWKNKGV